MAMSPVEFPVEFPSPGRTLAWKWAMSLVAMLYKGAHAELPRVARHLRHRLVRRARGNVHTDLLRADVPARRRDRVGRGRPPAPVAGPGHYRRHPGRDGRLLHRLRRGPLGRQSAG